MLHSPQSMEGESVSCTTAPCSIPLHHQHIYRTTDFSPQSNVTSLEINPDGSDIEPTSCRNNKRAASFETFSALCKRVKTANHATTPDPTPTPTSVYTDNLTPQTTPSTYVREEDQTDKVNSLHLRIQIPLITDDKPIDPSTTHADLDIAPISNTIVEVRKGLTAMGRALSSRERASVETHLLVAMETLKICHFGYFGSSTAERRSTLESGKVTPEPCSPISMINDVRGMELFPGNPAGPSMTSLISSSGIGPLRELVRLRQKQELVLEQKDLEIEAMRTENAGLNDQVYRLEGELYKAKLENQSTHASLKPTSDCDIAALISANKTLKIKIKNQTAHLKGLSEKCAQLKSAAKEEKEINITREQQVLKPAPISRLIEPASRQPIHESVKVTVAPPTDPTPTTDTTELQSPKSGSKSAVIPPPAGMGKKAKKKARAAERVAELAALALRKSEAPKEPVSADAELQDKSTRHIGPKPEVVDKTLRSSPRVSRVSISQKQVITTTRSGKGPSTNLTTLTARPILRWPNIENINALDSVNDKVDSATSDQSTSLSSSKRVPTGPKGLEGIMTKDCGMQVRGRGQVQGTRSDDGSSRLLMDAWNACLKSGRVGAKEIEVK